jgi:hypothetical protein
MYTIQSFVKRHPMVTFVALAYLLSWWSAPFVNGQIMPQGPAVAAVIVLAVTSGRSGLRSLWIRITHWNTSWYWYLIGPAIIAGYQSFAFALNILLGATVTNFPQLPPTGVLIELLLLGGLWEEPGWSGYMLPKMQERFSGRPKGALVATLVTGLVRASWHLPLFIYGHIPWFDMLIFSFAFQIIISWLFNHSGGSVPVVMGFHLASNIFGAIFNASTFAGADWTNYRILFMASACIIALLILWKSNLRLGQDVAQKELATVEPEVV